MTNNDTEPWAPFTRYAFSEDDYTNQDIQLHSTQIIPLLVTCIYILQSKYDDIGGEIK